MQFHLNGFRSGDPDVAEAAASATHNTPGGLPPHEVDALIVGCGPAGLTLAAQLAAFPDISTCVIEQKNGPLELGQADGIACRTMEMFNAFGFAERLLREAYWVNETSFWRPGDGRENTIVRSGRILDTEPGLSEFPHVILNQARIHDFYLDIMRRSAVRLEPYYGWRLVQLELDRDTSHPVTARFEATGPGRSSEIATVRARYAIGCDGARSGVRHALGQSLRGDSANQAWGVMDVLAVTDFPDARLKAVISSAEEGSIVLIPREGGYLFRIYVEMDKLAADERVRTREITVDDVIAATRRVISPYTLDVKQVPWWSVYEIGQRLCDRFDDLAGADLEAEQPRVFIAGDACHTHSPKAGQGMNVSMQDAFNLGWKLASVLRGQSPPSLLRTYNDERHAIATELIEFDREWAAMLSTPLRSAANFDGVDPADVESYFVRSGRYTAGTATRYAQSIVIGDSANQDLATGFVIGTRFHSAPVVRLGDAKKMQLGHVAQADGRWRLYAFADAADPQASTSGIAALCAFLASSDASPVVRYTPKIADVDSVIDVRAVFQQPYRELRFGSMPALLRPQKGRFALLDYEKMFCAANGLNEDIFDLRGVSRDRGCVVVVRPDQYIAHVIALDALDALCTFFNRFMLDQR